MPTYVVCRRDTGAEKMRYTSNSVVEWQDCELETHTHTAIPDVIQAVVVRTVQQWPTLDFLLRFSPTERITARALRATDAMLNDFFSLLDLSDTIHSDDKNTRRGMSYLVMLKVLTAERMAAILGDAA